MTVPTTTSFNPFLGILPGVKQAGSKRQVLFGAAVPLSNTASLSTTRPLFSGVSFGGSGVSDGEGTPYPGYVLSEAKLPRFTIEQYLEKLMAAETQRLQVVSGLQNRLEGWGEKTDSNTLKSALEKISGSLDILRPLEEKLEGYYAYVKFGLPSLQLGWEFAKLLPTLPQISLQRFFGYLLSPQFIRDLASKKEEDQGLWARKLISYAGVPLVKWIQGRIAIFKGMNLAEIDQNIQNLETMISKTQAARQEDNAQGTQEEASQELSALGQQLFTQRILRKLLVFLGPLHTQAPALPQKELQKELNALVEQFNAAPGLGENPIVPESIGQNNENMVGAASTAQIYKATRKNGEAVVLKVLRSDASKEFVDQYTEFTYRTGLLWFGSELAQRKESYEAAVRSTDVLRLELEPEFEKKSADRLREQFDEKKIDSLHVPEVYVCTSRGFVEAFVSTPPFDQLSSTEKSSVLDTVGYDLFRMILTLPVKHADLSPGNLMADATGETAASLIDFGRAIHLTAEDNRKLLQLFVSIFARQDETKRLAALDALLEAPQSVSIGDKQRVLEKLEYADPLDFFPLLLNAADSDGKPLAFKLTGDNVSATGVHEACSKFYQMLAGKWNLRAETPEFSDEAMERLCFQLEDRTLHEDVVGQDAIYNKFPDAQSELARTFYTQPYQTPAHKAPEAPVQAEDDTSIEASSVEVAVEASEGRMSYKEALKEWMERDPAFRKEVLSSVRMKVRVGVLAKKLVTDILAESGLSRLKKAQKQTVYRTLERSLLNLLQPIHLDLGGLDLSAAGPLGT